MKLLKLFTIVAFASALLVACEKNDPKQKTQEPVPYETPALAEAAAKVVFPASAVVTKSGETVKSIEFTEAGYAIILKEKVKADDGTNAFVTTYTFEQGIYKIVGFGNVEIKSGKVTITQVASGEEAPAENYDGNATVTNGSSSSDPFKVYYCAWEIMTTNVKVDGPGIGFDKLFNNAAQASDLYEIAKYVNEKKKVIDADEFKGYKVESVTLTQEGTIMVKFANDVNYVGTIEGGLKSKTFDYELDIEGNFMFSAKAKGTLDFDETTKICTLAVSGDFTYNNDSYKSTVTLTLKQKANI